MSQGLNQQKEKIDSNDNYELPEALLKECKKSFDLFDLETSGRINSRLISAYLSTVSGSNMIHYLLDGIEKLGDEIKYEDYLKHVKRKLKNSHKEEIYQKVAAFINLNKGEDIETSDLKSLSQELNLDLSDQDIVQALDTFKAIESQND